MIQLQNMSLKQKFIAFIYSQPLTQWIKNSIYFLLCALIFFLPWQTRWIYEIGVWRKQHFDFFTKSLYFTEIILGTIIFLTIIFFFLNYHQKPFSFSKRRLIFPLMLIIIFAFAIYSSTRNDLAFYKISQVISALSFFIVLLVNKIKWQTISVFFVFSGTFQALLAIWQFITNNVSANKWLGVASQNPLLLGTPIIELFDQRWIRAFGGLPHPNILGGFLFVSTFLSFALFLFNKNFKNFWFSLAIINLGGLLFSFSRSAIIPLIFLIFIVLWQIKKSTIKKPKKIKFMISLLAPIIIFVFLFHTPIKQRIVTDTVPEKTSVENRKNQLFEAENILKNNWFLGVGPGNYLVELQKTTFVKNSWEYAPPHNFYLLLLIEWGILAWPFIFWLFYLLFKKLKTIPNLDQSSRFLLFLFPSILFIAFWDHYFWTNFPAILLFTLGIYLLFSLEKPNANK